MKTTAESIQSLDSLVVRKIIERGMLALVDITLVRSLCEDHNKVCTRCGLCLSCTVPHYCCCGSCGPVCGHDHKPLKPTCHQEQELSHDLDAVEKD